MKKETIINISFEDKELAKFIGDRVVSLDDNEDYEVLNSYPALGEFSFRVFTKKYKKEDEQDD